MYEGQDHIFVENLCMKVDGSLVYIFFFVWVIPLVPYFYTFLLSFLETLLSLQIYTDDFESWSPIKGNNANDKH